MLADYVMKSIDNLFSDKLLIQQSNKFAKTAQSNLSNGNFNRDTIKKSLHKIIRKESDAQKSPKCRYEQSHSPVSKSRLKMALLKNKNERINSVIKRSANHKQEASPYKKIEIQMEGQSKRKVVVPQESFSECNKENNMIKYYREVRKSMTKLAQGEATEAKKSRIFFKNNILSHNVSKTEFKN